MNWSGKTVLITGAGSGIGRALAQEYDDLGADLSLIDIQSAKLEETVDTLSVIENKLETYHADVTDEARMNEIIEKTHDSLNGLDLVFANAGLGYSTPATNMNIKRVKKLLDVNIYGVVNTVVPAIPYMQENGGGHLAITSSSAAFRGFKGGAAYCASKAAVLRFGESLRADLNDQNINVSTIHPGWIETAMTDPIDDEIQFYKITADDAAHKIRRAIEKNKGRFVFPWPFKILTKLLSTLPDPILNYLNTLAEDPTKRVDHDQVFEG